MSIYQDHLNQSVELIQRAIVDIQPYAVVAMTSGGSDSLTSLRVAQRAGVTIDGLLHVRTGTGIHETTEFVRTFAAKEGFRYLEADAGDTYEVYVRRKGFFGVGAQAHAFSYHMLKDQFFTKLVSRNFRQGVRGRKILLINGVRAEESDNRKYNYASGVIRPDPGATSNIWVNIIWDWTKAECMAFLRDSITQLNPVVELLHRSGECMCGTMQSQEDRRMAEFFFPKWGKWLRDLERDVVAEFPWAWGEQVPSWWKELKRGQKGFGEEYFMPMCTSCQARNQLQETTNGD